MFNTKKIYIIETVDFYISPCETLRFLNVKTYTNIQSI